MLRLFRTSSKQAGQACPSPVRVRASPRAPSQVDRVVACLSHPSASKDARSTYVRPYVHPYVRTYVLEYTRALLLAVFLIVPRLRLLLLLLLLLASRVRFPGDRSRFVNVGLPSFLLRLQESLFALLHAVHDFIPLFVPTCQANSNNALPQVACQHTKQPRTNDATGRHHQGSRCGGGEATNKWQVLRVSKMRRGVACDMAHVAEGCCHETVNTFAENFVRAPGRAGAS